MSGRGVRWRLLPADELLAQKIALDFSLPEPVSRILAARGFLEPLVLEKFLRKSMNDLTNPVGLPGMERASDRLVKAITSKEKLVVHGDFDADGLTATALLTLFLRDVGAVVEPFIPNRLKEGHGLSVRGIEFAVKAGAKIVVTCDCGISNAKEIAELSALGIETIVTDHHAVPEDLPVGSILVNPKMDSGEEDLSGVGVAFMLCVALRSKLREAGAFGVRPEPNLKEYLDVVALGTLADMAPLKGQNRILVSHGLGQIALSRRPGIIAMKETSGLTDSAVIHSDDVGFRLAPRLNAAARMGHADEALRLLMTQDASEAEGLAKSVELWNQERKSLQEKMTRVAAQDAAHQIQQGRRSIVVSSPEFHVGVIGLVAQKLAQTYGVPAFVFARGDDLSRGSGRAGRGSDLMAALSACSSLCLGFGGHREAGGCSVETSNIGAFSKAFEKAVSEQGIAATREVLVDAEVNLRHLNEGVLRALDQLRPFGIGNPEPLLLSKAKVVGRSRQVGQGHLKLSLAEPQGGLSFSAIGFGMWEESFETISGDVEVVYTPEFNSWQGQRSIQLRLQGVKNA